MLLLDMMRRMIGRNVVCPKCGHTQSVRRVREYGGRCEKCGAALDRAGEKRSGTR